LKLDSYSLFVSFSLSSSFSFCCNRQNGSHRKRLEIVICTNFTGTHAHQQMAHIHTYMYVPTVVRLFLFLFIQQFLYSIVNFSRVRCGNTHRLLTSSSLFNWNETEAPVARKYMSIKTDTVYIMITRDVHLKYR